MEWVYLIFMVLFWILFFIYEYINKKLADLQEEMIRSQAAEMKSLYEYNSINETIVDNLIHSLETLLEMHPDAPTTIQDSLDFLKSREKLYIPEHYR